MKKINQNQGNKQQGVASLLISLILLICITLIVLFTSKTVLMETRMIADNHRTVQAVSAANYGVDLGVNYFDGGGFDQNDGLAVETPDTFIDTVADVTADGVFDLLGTLSLDAFESAVNPGVGTIVQTTAANLTLHNAPVYDNTVVPENNAEICIRGGAAFTATMKHGLIKAVGQSDDGTAERTVTECVGPLDILSDDGPDQPLVAQGQINLTGGANIINRYTSTNIWSGNKVKMQGSNISTYIGDDTAVTQANHLNPDQTQFAQLVSNKNLGLGLDIIDDDPSLHALKGEAFFINFFTSASRDAYENMVKGSGIWSTDIADAKNNAAAVPPEKKIKSGLVWIESPGNAATDTVDILATATFGSIDKPIILVINGNVKLNGAEIYGLLYVTGHLDVAGGAKVYGALIVEGTDTTDGQTPLPPPTVDGAGALTLVYWPDFLKDNPAPMDGLTAVVDGSWKDW